MTCAKISVAMTTYNGEKFIVEQLDSIRTQTRVPDEVIICDDKSQDNTVQLVKTYIRDYGLTNWQIIVNDINLGWKKNFFEAVKRITGDIVFFADQDDIWLPEKIETMSKLMFENNMGAIYASKTFINDEGILKPERMETLFFSHKLRQIPLTESFYTIKTLGCCMCVSRTIIDAYIDLGFYEGGHDSQCGRLALFLSTLWYLDEPIIKYRVHGNNTSGISADISFGASTLEKRIQSLYVTIKWLNLLQQIEGISILQQQFLQNCCNAILKRINYLKGEISVLQLFRFKKFYPNLTMFIGDFAYRHCLNSTFGKVRWLFK